MALRIQIKRSYSQAFYRGQNLECELGAAQVKNCAGGSAKECFVHRRCNDICAFGYTLKPNNRRRIHPKASYQTVHSLDLTP